VQGSSKTISVDDSANQLPHHAHLPIYNCKPTVLRPTRSKRRTRQAVCITAVISLSIILLATILLLILTVYRSRQTSPSYNDAHDQTTATPPDSLGILLKANDDSRRVNKVSRRPNSRVLQAAAGLSRLRDHIVTSQLTSSPPSNSSSDAAAAAARSAEVETREVRTPEGDLSHTSTVLGVDLLLRHQQQRLKQQRPASHSKTLESARRRFGWGASRPTQQRRKQPPPDDQRRRAESQRNSRRRNSSSSVEAVAAAGRHRGRELPSVELQRRARLTLRRQRQMRLKNQRRQRINAELATNRSSTISSTAGSTHTFATTLV